MWEACEQCRLQDENKWAYFAAAVISPHVKKGMTPKQLLEPLRKKAVKKRSKKDDEQYLREKFKL